MRSFLVFLVVPLLWISTVDGQTPKFRNGEANIIFPSVNCTTLNGESGRCIEIARCKVDSVKNGDAAKIDVKIKSNCKSGEECCPVNEIKRKPIISKTTANKCGMGNPGAFRSSVSVKRAYAEYSEFPWMIALFSGQDLTKDTYIGGGTLIHPYVVLTVAHIVNSVERFSELKCRAGEWQIGSDQEILPHQDRNTKKIIIHHEYIDSAVYYYYDAALLILESPFMLENAGNIGIACLARNLPPPGSLCYSVGWSQSFDGTGFNGVLRMDEMSTVVLGRCETKLRYTQLSSIFKVHHTFMCAVVENEVDKCVGEDGTPLMCSLESNEVNRYAVFGMKAFAAKCDRRNIPAVFARIPTLVDWVDGKMAEEKVNSTIFYNY